MTVTLRQRNKNGKISLYLDFYHKGKRKLEYLSLYLTEKPSTTEERALNKKTMQLAENIRAKRLLEFQNAKFGFSDSEKMNSKFLSYYELMAEKRCDSDGNYGNWLGALKHLKKWERSDVRFSDIDNIWLEDLKVYFLNNLRNPGLSKKFLRIRKYLLSFLKDYQILTLWLFRHKIHLSLKREKALILKELWKQNPEN